MKYGIFYNSPKAQCSIYESGLMIYNALKQSSKYIIEYREDKELNFDREFAIFNYHPYVNDWSYGELNRYRGRTFAIVLEVGHHGNLLPNTAPIFQKYMVIDPTITDTDTIFGFPRPIERFVPRPYKASVVTVGSFGFATQGKLWEEVVWLTNDQFDDALVRINIPFATFVPNCQWEIDKAVRTITSVPRKDGIRIEITHDYMDKNELIEWCAQNTINVFPYYRDLAGLAAVTDQAISAQRPILTTNNSAFRHINKYIKAYPEISLKDAITENAKGVDKMYQDWSPESFYKKFESIL